MAIREIVIEGDDILTKVCRPVEKFDEKLGILLDDMRETMVDADGVGLAAPQIGILSMKKENKKCRKVVFLVPVYMV